jgi:hypothetical protein
MTINSDLQLKVTKLKVTSNFYFFSFIIPLLRCKNFSLPNFLVIFELLFLFMVSQLFFTLKFLQFSLGVVLNSGKSIKIDVADSSQIALNPIQIDFREQLNDTSNIGNSSQFSENHRIWVSPFQREDTLGVYFNKISFRVDKKILRVIVTHLPCTIKEESRY